MAWNGEIPMFHAVGFPQTKTLKKKSANRNPEGKMQQVPMFFRFVFQSFKPILKCRSSLFHIISPLLQ